MLCRGAHGYALSERAEDYGNVCFLSHHGDRSARWCGSWGCCSRTVPHKLSLLFQGSKLHQMMLNTIVLCSARSQLQMRLHIFSYLLWGSSWISSLMRVCLSSLLISCWLGFLLISRIAGRVLDCVGSILQLSMLGAALSFAEWRLMLMRAVPKEALPCCESMSRLLAEAWGKLRLICSAVIFLSLSLMSISAQVLSWHVVQASYNQTKRAVASNTRPLEAASMS